MNWALGMSEAIYDELVAHLLPVDAATEHGAFLFARKIPDADGEHLEVVHLRTLAAEDFTCQAADYLELADETRAALIKEAHDRNAVLVETHSHLGPLPAAFSDTDHGGFADTVPHMHWRLPNRPYLALVFTQQDFDALVWPYKASAPQALQALRVAGSDHRPTNLSLLAVS